MKRFLMLTLTLLLVLGIFASCKKEEKPSVEPEEKEQSINTEETEADTSTENPESTEPENTNTNDEQNNATEPQEQIDNAVQEPIYNSKVGAEVQKMLEEMDESEYISLTVHLKTKPLPTLGDGYSEGQIASKLSNFVRNFNLYKQEHGEMELCDLSVDTFRELSGLTDKDLVNDWTLASILENNRLEGIESVRYIIEIYGIYEDTRAYRTQVKNNNTARNEEFCALLDMEQCRSIDKNPLIAVVTLECKRDYVLELQEISIVSSINYYDPSADEIMDVIEEENVDTSLENE